MEKKRSPRISPVTGTTKEKKKGMTQGRKKDRGPRQLDPYVYLTAAVYSFAGEGMGGG
jgi:hypothetical protein